MNTEDKLETIRPQVTTFFETGNTLDVVCGLAVPLCLEQGIAFSEILPLVKQIGRDNGFIVELADRKANFKTDVCKSFDGFVGFATYHTYMKYIEENAIKYDIPVKWATHVVNDWLRTDGLLIPKKPQLAGWQLSALECWQNEYSPSLLMVRAHLKQNDHNRTNYTQAYHELFTALVNLKEEVK